MHLGSHLALVQAMYIRSIRDVEVQSLETTRVLSFKLETNPQEEEKKNNNNNYRHRHKQNSTGFTCQGDTLLVLILLQTGSETEPRFACEDKYV